MTKPVHLVFRFFQKKERIEIWLYEQPDLRIEGRIIVKLSQKFIIKQGFDEYMNIVLEDAVEVFLKKKIRREVGKIMIKGDNVTLIGPAAPPEMSVTRT